MTVLPQSERDGPTAVLRTRQGDSSWRIRNVPGANSLTEQKAAILRRNMVDKVPVFGPLQRAGASTERVLPLATTDVREPGCGSERTGAGWSQSPGERVGWRERTAARTVDQERRNHRRVRDVYRSRASRKRICCDEGKVTGGTCPAAHGVPRPDNIRDRSGTLRAGMHAGTVL